MGFSSFLRGSTIILQFTSDHSAEFIQTLWEALAYSVQLLKTQPPPHPNSLHITTLLLRMWPLKTAWTFAVRSKMALCRSFAVDQSLPLSAPPSLRRWVSHIIVFGLKSNTHTQRRRRQKLQPVNDIFTVTVTWSRTEGTTTTANKTPPPKKRRRKKAVNLILCTASCHRHLKRLLVLGGRTNHKQKNNALKQQQSDQQHVPMNRPFCTDMKMSALPSPPTQIVEFLCTPPFSGQFVKSKSQADVL